jgi:hypothetical protein
VDLPWKSSTLGVRVYDNYGQYYSNGFDSIPDDDMELLQICLGLEHESDDDSANVLTDSIALQKGLCIGNTWYDWEQIEPYVKDKHRG